MRRIRRERKISLYITGDEEKKTDKATRIERTLEPLNREGNLVLNEAEKDNPHMKRMAEQFKLFNLQLTYPADGPDCVEGGNRIIDRKARQSEKPVNCHKEKHAVTKQVQSVNFNTYHYEQIYRTFRLRREHTPRDSGRTDKGG